MSASGPVLHFVRVADAPPFLDLPEAERALLGPAATQKRRQDFAAGRHAGRAAIQALAVSQAWTLDGPVLIGRARGDDAGRPIVVQPARSEAHAWHVSISHADGVAVAAAWLDHVGIDIVTIEDHGPAFAIESFTPRERRTIRTPEDACALFAAKEACLKWLGCGLRESLQNLELEEQSPDVLEVRRGSDAHVLRICRQRQARQVVVHVWQPAKART